MQTGAKQLLIHVEEAVQGQNLVHGLDELHSEFVVVFVLEAEGGLQLIGDFDHFFSNRGSEGVAHQ